MTTYRSVLDEARKPENRAFFAPSFQVRIDGENLPQNVLRDVIELKYIDGLTEIDRFELTVNNWDSDQKKFRFIGSEPDDYLTDSSAENKPYVLFQPCKKTVEIKLGYADNLVTMMLGNFTSMEPSFPSSGAPTLTVTGLNILHQFRRKKYSHSWINEKPSAIALNLATLTDDGEKRLPIPIGINEEAQGEENPLDYTAQTNQYDVDFLLNLARRHSYEMVIQEANEESGTPRQIYFGPGSFARPPINYRLEWGRTLVDFNPVITSHNQVKSVRVNGWDRAARESFHEVINFDDDEMEGLNSNVQEFIQCDPREELVVDRPVFSREEAKRLARDIMRDRASSVIKARGTTIGLPELRAGTKVQIGELGARLSGDYLVTKTEHSFTDAGYQTRFEARLENLPEQAS
ncbi:phage late control D family protein [Erythrobacter ani]|uniref:Phage late control D family protein n=1 Tax=Erythrobacter ani TaxID=2827235 RepID=A0ABS6SNM4_9SPHN|nr:hypothetical protein [Erythrobacter ani]MBV7266244.1 phage late control D family protein [Erythrobacter ani]